MGREVLVGGALSVSSLALLCTLHWTCALSSPPAEWGTLIFVHRVGEKCACLCRFSVCLCVCCAVYI